MTSVETRRIHLVTPWGTACGIAEHVAYLRQATGRQAVRLLDQLHPQALVGVLAGDLVWLNYHAALHSAWTPDAIRQVQAGGAWVGVTYHDTGVPNSDQCKAIIDAADVAVVHEPFDDLPGEKTYYWRMGVPTRPRWEGSVGVTLGERLFRMPVLGTVGFPFGWKCYDQLAEVTAQAGWGLLLIAPGATPEQVTRWRAINPKTLVTPTFLPRDEVTDVLATCTATAFTYVCHNTGQSAAILQGIAALNPVIAFSTCRQFRALYADPLGRTAIHWVETFEEVRQTLDALAQRRQDGGGIDYQIDALAAQESWTHVGAKYRGLWTEFLLRGAR